MRKNFEVIKMWDASNFDFSKFFEDTFHSFGRRSREELCEELIETENAETEAVFLVDRGHWDGREYHVLYTNGVAEIFNEDTCRRVTALISRPGQLIAYYKAFGLRVPKEMFRLAREHEYMGYNND